MRETYQVAVIGAGPAGMAAAVEAAGLNLSVVVLDAQPMPGGQLYRALETQTSSQKNIFGDDYFQGGPLIEAFRQSGVEYVPGAKVWEVTQNGAVHFLINGEIRRIQADQIIIASGAQERPCPIPGWTLPGVMTAGAAQILLKSASMGARDAVFAGSGPLLYLVVWQYVQAGLPVAAVLETTPSAHYLRAAPYVPMGLAAPANLVKGLKLMAGLRKSGIPWVRNVEDVRIDGEGEVRSVSYLKGASWRDIETRHVFLHQGVVPDINLTVSIGCRHGWNEDQACRHVVRDQWGRTSVDGILVAGDGGSIGGGVAAGLQGRLSAIAVGEKLGAISESERNRRSRNLLRSLARERRARTFLDVLYAPRERFRRPVDDATVVCRCEGVTAGDVRSATDLGSQGPNQLKVFTRAGMGPCQGRMCGLTISEIMAQTGGASVADSGYLRTRAPVLPITLGALARFDESET